MDGLGQIFGCLATEGPRPVCILGVGDVPPSRRAVEQPQDVLGAWDPPHGGYEPRSPVRNLPPRSSPTGARVRLWE